LIPGRAVRATHIRSIDAGSGLSNVIRTTLARLVDAGGGLSVQLRLD
jgi:hypothetical protein